MEEERNDDIEQQLEESTPEEGQEPEKHHFADELAGNTDENVDGQATAPEELPEDQPVPDGPAGPENVPSIAEGLPAGPAKEPPKVSKPAAPEKAKPESPKKPGTKVMFEPGSDLWNTVKAAIPKCKNLAEAKTRTGRGRDFIFKVKEAEGLEFGSAAKKKVAEKAANDEGADQTEEKIEEKAASGVLVKHGQYVSDTAMELDKQLIALGRHAYENYTARAGHWGVSIPQYLQFTTQFYENNSVSISEMEAKFAEMNILIIQQKQIIEQSFKILKTRTLVLDMLDKMMKVSMAGEGILKRDEIVEIIWATLALEEKGI